MTSIQIVLIKGAGSWGRLVSGIDISNVLIAEEGNIPVVLPWTDIKMIGKLIVI